MKRTILIVVILLMGLCACETAPQLESTIFPDVERIDIIDFNGTTFSYYAPKEVKYLVLGIFDGNISVNTDTMTIDDYNLLGGSHSGIGMGRGSVTTANIYFYDPATKNFNSIVMTIGAVTGTCWAVWGYDEFGNLTHASQQENDTY